MARKPTQDKVLAAAIARLERLKLAQAFDPFVLDSRPTEQQDAIFKAINDVQFRYVRAGNRCLAKGTLVATLRGSRRIEDIQIGELVYDENNNLQVVVGTWNNGVKRVGHLVIKGSKTVIAKCTAEHKWWDGKKKVESSAIKEVYNCLDDVMLPVEFIPDVEEVETYDITVSGTNNVYSLADGTVTSNSGKSALAARELTWILNEQHPYWKRPKAWGTAPLLCLVVGKSRQNIEVEIWANKLRPFLDPGQWKEIRSGNVLQKVENTVTKDQIVFLTHADSSDRVIDNLQGYTAHYVWVDEMPNKLRVLEELQQRVATTRGPFIATFTPKVLNIEIKNFVDSVRPPIGARYPLYRLNNPVFADSIEQELQKLEGLPKPLQKAILEGEWMIGSEAVFAVDYDSVVTALPSTYHRGWRHVESVDPGARTTGYTLWAEDPATDIWYCIRSEYIEEERDPVRLFETIQAFSRGYNVVRRVCDPAASYYIGYASTQRVSYTWPYAKNQNRNEDLIRGLQHAMSSGKIKITPVCDILLEELTNAMWNEAGSRIINSHRFHTVDCAKYFVDCMPKPDKTQLAMTPHDFIYQQNEKRKALIAKQQKLKEFRLARKRVRW